jgi:hypothetical protein
MRSRLSIILSLLGLEQLHALAEGFGHAGQLHGAGRDVRRHVGRLVRLRLQGLGEARSGLSSTEVAEATSASVAARWLLAGLVHGLQQGAEPFQQRGAFLQREVVALRRRGSSPRAAA